jgi:NAD(P)-dependent dehydrogenase (short-subunit alcohol dehydrogenase family)
MDLKLTGRTVLVTGGSKGIGLGVGQWFAAEGCNVRLAARSKDLLDEGAAAIRKEHKVEVRTMAGDLSKTDVRAKIIEAWPDIDVLVNNAGGIPSGTIDDVDDAAWRAGWDLKVFGYIDLTRAYLKRMRERGRGVIINIIGAAGESLPAGYIAGCVGNASLMAFTRSIGTKSPDFGVRIVGVNPGPVDTGRVETLGRKRAERELGDPNRWREYQKSMPFGRPATVAEIAALVVFLASDLSSYTSGVIFTVDGGNSLRRGGMSAG